MIRFLMKGWVRELYVAPRFHFSYEGFGWIQPLPGDWMHLPFIGLAILGLMVAAGFYYRVAIVLFFLGFTYVELIDQTAYLNHYYLISLLSGLLIFLPAHRAWSVDVWRQPSLRRDITPTWTVQLLRFQIAVVYIFAGLAKVNSDWLLRAEPLRIWLAARSDLPLIGDWLQPVWVAYVASWSGALYDLTIVFFLLWPRSRKTAFLLVILFHTGTWVLFNIGMFPWIMIIATTIFFRPDWPRRFFDRCSEVARRCFRWRVAVSHQAKVETDPAALPAHPRWLLTALLVYASVQVLLPLRPYLLGAGHPAWSYRGFNLAWQVMVAEKTGYVEFYTHDLATGQRTRIKVRDYLTPRQEMSMAQDPNLIRALAQKIAADRRQDGIECEVVVNAFATINGRPSQRIVGPETDLASATGRGWILPLRQQN